MKNLPVKFTDIGAFRLNGKYIRYAAIEGQLWIVGRDVGNFLGVVSSNHFFGRIPDCDKGSVMKYVNMTFLRADAVKAFLLTHPKRIASELLWKIFLIERGKLGRLQLCQDELDVAEELEYQLAREKDRIEEEYYRRSPSPKQATCGKQLTELPDDEKTDEHSDVFR